LQLKQGKDEKLIEANLRFNAVNYNTSVMLVLVLKNSLRTSAKSLSLWRSLSMSWSLL